MDVDQPWEPLEYPLELYPSWEPKDAPVLLGIDEAGRGPTLGPMVYAAAFCLLSDKDALAKAGYMDSKQLKLEKRESLFASLRSAEKIPVGYVTRVLTAEELSGKMLDIQRSSLNEISHDAAIEMIKRAIAQGFNVKEIYVDTADSLYPIVSAASIVAKVTRDRILDGWVFKEDEAVINDGRSWGSGYPADARTRTWMKKNIDKVFGFPDVMRFSWKPCAQILGSAAVPVDFGDNLTDADMEGGSTPSAKRTSSRKNSLSSSRAPDQTRLQFGSGAQRFRFFTVNDMQVVNDF